MIVVFMWSCVVVSFSDESLFVFGCAFSLCVFTGVWVYNNATHHTGCSVDNHRYHQHHTRKYEYQNNVIITYSCSGFNYEVQDQNEK